MIEGVLIQIRKRGQSDEAKCYAKIMSEFITDDNRNNLVRKAIKKLQATTKTTTSHKKYLTKKEA